MLGKTLKIKFGILIAFILICFFIFFITDYDISEDESFSLLIMSVIFYIYLSSFLYAVYHKSILNILFNICLMFLSFALLFFIGMAGTQGRYSGDNIGLSLLLDLLLFISAIAGLIIPNIIRYKREYKIYEEQMEQYNKNIIK